MESVDVSRLSVAECLALAEQQDAEKVTGSVEDPVERMIERLIHSPTISYMEYLHAASVDGIPSDIHVRDAPQ